LNTTEQILGKLRANEPFEKIRAEVRSISTLYEIGGQFLDELQTRLGNIGAQVSEAEEEQASLEAQIESLRCEQENCRKKTENRSRP
jgi:septation ring formation regulator EzrA